MALVPSLVLATLLVFPCRPFLRRRAGVCYLLAAILSVLGVSGLWSGLLGELPAWCARYVTPMITHGSLAAALFFYVMFAGAATPGSRLMRQVIPIRGQLSILAGIFALGHAFALGKAQLLHALVGALGGPLSVVSFWVSLALTLVMLPLFVTSFLRIRRKMRPRAWKRFQRTAYVFYALTILHVLLMKLPSARSGSLPARLDVLLYGALFLSYAVLRVRRALLRRSAASSAPREALCAAGALLMAALIAFTLWPSVNRQPAPSSQPVTDAAPAQTIVHPAADPQTISGTAPAETASQPNPADADAPTRSDTDTDLAEAAAQPDSAGADSPAYTDGTYTGRGMGFNGQMKVTVTVENGRLTAIQIKSTVDDPEYIDMVKSTLIPAILSAQSTQVDAVSGATSTSHGLLDAVSSALAQ